MVIIKKTTEKKDLCFVCSQKSQVHTSFGTHSWTNE